MSPPQRLRAGLLRGCLRLLFRGLVRPPMPVALQRGVLRGLSLATLGAGGVVRERRSLAGVLLRVVAAARVEARRRVLHLHGGAYLIGSPATHRAITTHLARRCAAEVCAVDYRRAPGTSVPAARDDALAVYLALLEAGHSPRRLLLAGDSAGGHLALSLALELKARGLPLPAGLLLFSPWTDLGCQRLHTPAAGDPLLSRAWLESAVRLLLPADAEPGSAALSPLHADLASCRRCWYRSARTNCCATIACAWRNGPVSRASRCDCSAMPVAGTCSRLMPACWPAPTGRWTRRPRSSSNAARRRQVQNILISGAASGIGAASARLFHRRGWRVGLLDIDAEALRGLAAQLPGAWHRAVDVSEPDAVGEALAQFCADGRLRLLFNCAGVLRFGRFEEVALEDHARLLAINLQGVLNCCHAAFPFLRAMPQAQVLNMGSASGLYGVPEMAVYSASKFAVRGLTEALELEWRRHGIRVADLMPPFVRTPMVAGQPYQPPVLRRLGLRLDAEDIAEAAWRQAHSRRVHRPVGGLFTALYWAGSCLRRG